LMGEVVKLPQPDDWKNLLEVFLFEKKPKENPHELFPIISSTFQCSLSVFLELYVRRKSFCLKD